MSKTGVHGQSAQKGCQAPPPQTRKNYYNKQITVNDFYDYFAMIKISLRSHERNFTFWNAKDNICLSSAEINKNLTTTNFRHKLILVESEHQVIQIFI